RVAALDGRGGEGGGRVDRHRDTKVVERGKADGCYVTTSGIGTPRPARPAERRLRAAGRRGHRVGADRRARDHRHARRGELDIEADLRSDTAPLNTLVDVLLDACGGADGDGSGDGGAVRCLRDATRGGVATVVNEIAEASRVAVVLDEDAVPVRPAVRGGVRAAGGSTRSTSPARGGWSRWWPGIPPTRRWPPSAPIRSAPRRRSSGGSTTTRRGWSCSGPPSAAPAIVDLLVGDRYRESAEQRANPEVLDMGDKTRTRPQGPERQGRDGEARPLP
ncbi:AIR synthase-related protein, partial [Streptosporangium vulgare]|uniref:AIR synthase-related protein n=1 Tax=Streptosporangium vulgare TaxID=46190 RepID=UPI003CD0802C